MTRGICLPLSEYLDLVWWSLCPSTVLKITSFSSGFWPSHSPLRICSLSFLICSSMEGYLGFFHALDIVNIALLSFVVYVCFQQVFILWIYAHPSVRQRDAVALQFLIFRGTSLLFSRWLLADYIATESIALLFYSCPLWYLDFPGGSNGKASAYNAGDPGLIPGLGRSSGVGNGNPFQYSCLENPMDGEAL